MAGVRDEYDNKGDLHGVPTSQDLVAYFDSTNGWGGQFYDPVCQHQHWYGCYPPQQQQDWGTVGQAGVIAPLPAMFPPQAPSPASLATTPMTGGSGLGGGNGVIDFYSEYDNYAHQLGQEFAGYRLGGMQAMNYGNSMPHAHAHPVATNGSQSHLPGYSGYNYMPDQNAYGSIDQGYNHRAFQKQGTESYSQTAAMYSNVCSPYAPSTRYQHSVAHTETLPHGSTENYCDPDGDQSARYRHSDDGERAQTAWDKFNEEKQYYAAYAASNVNLDAAYGVVNPEPNDNMQCAQDYVQQWTDYYASVQAAPQANTEPNGAEPAAHLAAPTYCSAVAAPTPPQPPPPGTAEPQPSWQAPSVLYGELQGSQVSLTPESRSTGTALNCSSNLAFRSDHFNESYFPPLAKHSRTPAIQYEQHPLDVQKVQAVHKIQQPDRAKLHVVTNPRIAGNVSGLGAGKETTKPVYVSVTAKKPSSSVSTDAVADATLQPGMFPSSLRAYVERALSRCKDELQKAACRDIMKDMITDASLDRTLFTRDWDTEPLFAIPPESSSLMRKERSQQETNSGQSELRPVGRLKTRWEPSVEVENNDKARQDLSFCGIAGTCLDSSKDKDSFYFLSRWEKQEENWSKTNTMTTAPAGSDSKNLSKRGSKRLRKVDLTLKWGDNASSGSKAENGHGVQLGSLSAADIPEEMERRQNRFKRFDRGKDYERRDKYWGRRRGLALESANARRSSALQLTLNSGEGQNGRAVEDINWDSLTLRGTCLEVEKGYLRLTSAPDPQTVRPEDVLRRALEMVKSTRKSYLFKCEQLKSIRQDLTVQRIRDEFTVEVYETHARMALEARDLPEYNQCQTQLKSLYREGIKGCSNEFAAYGLLYVLFNYGNSTDLLSAMSRLTRDRRGDDVVKHALAVRNAVAAGNYTTFFRLYRSAPVLSPCLMDIHMEKMRFEGFKCMTRSYRPTIPVTSVAHTLGFTAELSSEVRIEGMDECEVWLRAHGAHVQFDSSSSEFVVEAKLSTTSLFMPEPDDVPHGDANLALNDFFSRS